MQRTYPTLVLLILVPLAAGQTIPANHEYLQYIGRIDATQPKSPKLSWPASAIHARFTGKTLKIQLDDSKGKNQFDVYIDGDESKPHRIVCKQGSAWYDVPLPPKKGTRELLVWKRTEGGQGETVFGGLDLGSDAKLLPPPPRAKTRIEVIGDSISVGLGNEAKNKKQEHSVAARNSYLAYGAIVARQLKAEYHCTSKSGIGLIKSWFPITMPNYYDKLSAADGMTKKWDFKQWQPNIVVINLFQNDSWTLKKGGDADRVAAYVAFVKTLRGHYPKARIVCTLGSMSAGKSKWAGYVKSAVKKLNQDGDKQIHAYIFKVGTGHMHPKVSHHQAMAKELLAFLKSL